MILSYAFLGPVPYLAFYTPTLTTVSASLMLLGLSSTALVVASFGCAQRAAVKAGFPDSPEVQDVISGLFTSFYALGTKHNTLNS